MFSTKDVNKIKARMDLRATAGDGLRALSALESYINASDISRGVLDLVRLRVSQINGCAFCVDLHAYDLKQAGESDERIWALAAWRDAPYYSEAERAALALAETATRLHDNPNGVMEPVWDLAAMYYPEGQLAVLVLAIASINAWNRINVANRQVAGAARHAGP
ncbi:hypothetical protein ThrDRAFT_04324 [Frankia casuarinae]|jgi:AhpD family alkylhydroperoxidase|nr:carboxymuconolactone decarboxylase family protein [Frankia casuarinae]EYT90062.1 hypothetical protein ThrDRAFT_04324 [Frankia casuarinae]